MTLGLVVAALLLASLGPVARVASADSGLGVVQTGAQSEFPKRLDFAVQAQSSAVITAVRIAYRVSDDPVVTIAKATFTPAPRVDARYTLDLARSYYPVGVTIHYQWQVQDQSGATGVTAWQDLKVSDPRFLWHERTQGRVTLHWYDGDSQFADAVLNAAATTLDASAQTGAARVTSGVDVYLYGTTQDFQSALGAGTNTWVGGLAFPLYRDVVLLAPANDLTTAQRSVAEEMTHVALDSTEEDPFGPLPTWLDEGLAVTAEGQTDPAFAQALQQAASAHRLLSIQAISGNFSEDPAEATLAYAESESIARYFLRTYGSGALAKLIAAFRQGATSDEAFQQAIGKPTLEFQKEWQASLGGTQPVAQTGTSAAPTPGSSIVNTLLAPINFVVRVVQEIIRQAAGGKTAA